MIYIRVDLFIYLSKSEDFENAEITLLHTCRYKKNRFRPEDVQGHQVYTSP